MKEVMLEDKELIYIWDALYCLTETQASGCCNEAGKSMQQQLLDKFQKELERRNLG